LFNSKASRRPLKQSGLRKATRPDDEDDSTGRQQSITKSNEDDDDDDGDDDGPPVVRPLANRMGSSKFKKRPGAKSSKVSFGADSGDSGTDQATKKFPLGLRALENNAARSGLGTRGLPMRSVQDDDDERPKYSKAYLDELQSSTPNTPQAVSPRRGNSDEMELDPSELDGALIVETEASLPSNINKTTILSEAEIQEKKDRRARLAKEKDFLSVEDDEDEARWGRKKKDDTRLVAEDEEMGEGFDDYVEDGGLSLGKRAERERRKQERKQMAELITAAEGHSSDDSSDSDAERRIAYEAAQSRAGLDGLVKPRKDPAEELLQVPPKITPLPSLSECLSRLQVTLQGMEAEIKNKNTRMEQLHKEKQDIARREAEVQALLDETGKKYQEAMGRGKAAEETAPVSGPAAELVGERGLESLGTTPGRQTNRTEDDVS
jgi:hypothetical protein